jgi:hypothetical protein
MTRRWGETKDGAGFVGYQLARRSSHDSSENTLRTMASSEYKKMDRISSEHTMNSGRTDIDADVDGGKGGAFGVRVVVFG